MPQIELPEAPAPSTKAECWFEVNLDFKADVQRGHPTRIFTSKDPRWAEILADPKTKSKRGCLMFGSYLAAGEEFLPGSVKITDSATEYVEHAQRRMADYEKRGKVYETPKADAVREHEELTKRGEERQAKMIADALAALQSGGRSK